MRKREKSRRRDYCIPPTHEKRKKKKNCKRVGVLLAKSAEMEWQQNPI